MMTELIEWLERELNERGWSMRTLAKRAEVSVATVSNVMAGKTPPTFDFVAAVARALHVRPEQALRKAGLLPAIRGDESTAELLELFSALTPEERRSLRQYAEFLLSQREDTAQGESPAEAGQPA